MAETAAEARSKLGRTTSNVFIALFALAAVIAAGFLIGLVPAVKAYRNTLADGLSVRL